MVNILPGGSIEGLLYSVYCTVYSTVPIWYLLLEQTLGFRRARVLFFSRKTNLSSGKSLAQEFDQVAENRKVANSKFGTNLEFLMKNLCSEQSEMRCLNNTLQVANSHSKSK